MLMLHSSYFHSAGGAASGNVFVLDGRSVREKDSLPEVDCTIRLPRTCQVHLRQCLWLLTLITTKFSLSLG